MDAMFGPARANQTGLPDHLKSGIESLSNLSLDHVRVHYNSSQPAALNALAYTQGTDIHVAPGQERHLPHEAWHVVQQAQDRVRPTTQMKSGVPVNDDRGLEREADVMGAEAATFSSADRANDAMSTASPSVPVVQGRFMAGYRPIPPETLSEFFQRWKAALWLERFEAEFNGKNTSNKDEGTFEFWLRSKVPAGDIPPEVAGLLAQPAMAEGHFRRALRTTGAQGPAPGKGISLAIDILKNIDERDAESMASPPSPRGESRILQIPRLVALILRQFRDDPLLREFEFVVGGGSALALKRPGRGRLGRSSENMRDIDMDFQIGKDRAAVVRAMLSAANVKNKPEMMELIKNRMYAAIEKLPPELAEALKTDDRRVSGRNTIMFNAGDLEYSFHFVDEDVETERRLEVEPKAVDALGEIKLIRDDSHWFLTKSALRARLKRPDKIHKTLIDACVLIGHNDQRLQEAAAILFSGARRINTTRNTLRRLAGPDVLEDAAAAAGAAMAPAAAAAAAMPPAAAAAAAMPPAAAAAAVMPPAAAAAAPARKVKFEGKPISGLHEGRGPYWREYLLGRTPSHYDRNERERLDPIEIGEVRADYSRVITEILDTIITQAGAARADIRDNAMRLRSAFTARFDDAIQQGAMSVPTIRPRREYRGDEDLADPFSGPVPPPESRESLNLPDE